MEDGLVRYIYSMNTNSCVGLNPCCNGRWSRTAQHIESFDPANVES